MNGGTEIPGHVRDAAAEAAHDAGAMGLNVDERPDDGWYTLDGERTGLGQLSVRDRDGYVLRDAQTVGHRPTAGDKANRDHR